MALSITRTADPAGVSAASNKSTYSSVSIGTASADRIIAVLVGTELTASTPSGCTIDYGSGAVAMDANTGGNFGAVFTQIYTKVVPSGTTATIVVTYSATNPLNTANHIAVYSIVGADATIFGKGGNGSTDMDATAPLTTGSITIPSGGGFLAVSAGATDAVGKTWANATEDLDEDAGGFQFGTASTLTAGTKTITCTGGTNGEDGAMSWVIFSNAAPTVALSSPADAATGVSTSPALTFTGTDTAGDDIRYNVEVVTSPATVSATNLTSGSANSAILNSITTASITPSANKLVLLSVSIRNNASTNPATPSVSGNGLTWVLVNSLAYDTGGGTRKNLFLFRALGASPTTGAITVTFAESNTDATWIVDEFTNTDTSGTNGSGAIVQSVATADQSGTQSAQTVTLGAFTSVNNATYGVLSMDSTTTWTVGSGFTQVGVLNGTSMQNISEFNSANDTTVDATFTNSPGNASGGIAVEIKPSYTSVYNSVSGTDSGFSGTPDNTDPFTSGQAVTFTPPSALSNSTVYYWRVRGIDPSGGNAYGAWTAVRTFTTAAGGGGGGGSAPGWPVFTGQKFWGPRFS